ESRPRGAGHRARVAAERPVRRASADDGRRPCGAPLQRSALPAPGHRRDAISSRPAGRAARAHDFDLLAHRRGRELEGVPAARRQRDRGPRQPRGVGAEPGGLPDPRPPPTRSLAPDVTSRQRELVPSFMRDRLRGRLAPTAEPRGSTPDLGNASGGTAMSNLAVRPAEADAFGKVETHGIDALPAAERHGEPRELALLSAGAFVNYASLFTASLLTTYYGLGVWDGLAAAALGTLAGAV